jgi:flagellar biosynthesis/type III secretory pathway protein FliH
MPSSSWHLIHNGEGSAAPAQPEVAAAVASGSVSTAGSAVLRGNGRGNSGRSTTTSANSRLTAQKPAGSEDQEAIDEEIRRLQQAAEERGYEIGRNRAEAELRGAIEGAAALADRLHSIAPERTSEIAHSIAELALSVAKRIVEHEVRTEPSLLCAALEAAVSTINGSPEAHVMLNPEAVEPVTQAWEALHGRAYLGKKWTFEGDPTLPIGGCTLRYEHGFVEAGLEAQLEEIGIALDRAIPNLARGTLDEEVA